MAIAGLNTNPTFLNTKKSSEFWSSKLLNYVEPIEIGGYRKTTFFTEKNCNFNVGDRVFIVNGSYDSNEYIKKDKWGKYTDGWRVLGCDGCRVVLDVDWTGEKPFNSVDIDNSLGVYNIRTQREFDWINYHQFATPTINVLDPVTESTIYTFNEGLNKLYSGEILTIAELNTINGVLNISLTDFAHLLGRSIIWVSGNFNGSNDPVIRNTGITTGSGFYMKVFGTSDWINITNYVLSNRLKLVNPSINWNGKLIVYNENFTQSGNNFIEGNIYKFEGGKWTNDPSTKQPFISKNNFRSGKFGLGTHQDGIFGTYEKQNRFDGGDWTSGIFLNSIWLSGTINSKSKTNVETLIGRIDGTSSISQVPDLSNNGGFGWNLFYDSDINKAIITGGNFENCNVGIPTQSVAIDQFYGITQSFDISGSFAKFTKCDIDTIKLTNSLLQNNFIKNSYLETTKVVNCQVEKTVIDKNSEWDDRTGITINSADIWSYWDDSLSQNLRGVLKLYIGDSDYEKLKFGNVFYISKINKDFILSTLDDHARVHLPIETKWILESYFNSTLPNVNDKIIVSIKTKVENSFSYLAQEFPVNNPPTKRVGIFSGKELASIDIDCTNFGIYSRTYSPRGIVYGPNYLLGAINYENVSKVFENTQINNAELGSGIFNKSNWVSGDHVNYQFNIMSSVNTGSLDSLRTRLLKSNLWDRNSDLPGKDIQLDDWIWISPSIENDNGVSVGGKYKVINIFDGINFRDVYLQTQDGFTFSGLFSYGNDLAPNYMSIHQTIIQNSTITSGFFRRSLFQNNTFVNSDFNNGDRVTTSENSSKLKLLNIYFRNTNNTIKGGIIYKSHFVNDIWESGILFNSIWKGGTFGGGIFKKGYWLDGTFSTGFFVSNSATQSNPFNPFGKYDYDTTPNYMNWNKGTFLGGEFYQSVWSDGTFVNGRFYYSDFYSGRFSNGILGSKLILENLTKFGSYEPLPISTTSSVFENGIVENAIIGGGGDVYWINGRFEKGTFTTDTGKSVWYAGDFIGGKFTGVAEWKNGNFYGGKFLSSYRYTLISPPVPNTNPSNYSWQGGKFYGGEFGNGSTGSNSTWYNGEFRGGIFKGRLWRSGLMDSGVFLGSGQSNIYSSPDSPEAEQEWVNSFSDNFYGFWFSGNVVDDISSWLTSDKVATPPKRKVDDKKIDKKVLMSGILWRDGIFSHNGGTIQNSVWLNGTFTKGTFDSSVFNAYVDRTFQSQNSQSSYSGLTCVWLGGEFKSTLGTGSFYHSEWKKGNFRDGYIMGSVWRDGTFWYGKADNIYWESGRWKNGTWNGSPYDSTVLSDWTGNSSIEVNGGRATESILFVAAAVGSDYIHMNNVFSASVANNILEDINVTSISATGSWTFSLSDIHTNANGLTGNCATWSFGTTFSLSNGTFTDTHIYTNGGDWGRFSYPTTPPSTKIWAWNGVTKNIFVLPDTNYQIELRLAVDETDEVEVEFGVGGLPPQTRSFSSNRVGNSIYNQVFEISLAYRTTQTLIDSFDNFGEEVGKQFYMIKKSSGILRILYARIYQLDIEYHPEWNNNLYLGVSSSNIYLPNDPNLYPNGPSVLGDIVSIRFGNGCFRKGIWENGIWNDGWRSWEWFGSPDVVACDGVIGIDGIVDTDTTYQTDLVSWLLKLKCLNDDGTSRFADVSILSIGDYVSVGNIVAIDVNERRRSISDPLRVVSIDSVRKILTLAYVTNFPVRRIINDSQNHLVYVTKNIWKSGAFLNGYFTGVWSGGLVKGYPKITKLESTQFIEGKFDGGHFKSVTDNVPFSNTRTFNTGLVQNFRFFDNNVAPINSRKFLSWMDINYYNESRTNLNKDNVNFKIVPLANGTGSFFVNQRNLWGSPTVDVLKSISTFRDFDDTFLRNYSLGYNLTKYSNLMSDKGNFLKPFTTLYDQVGMDNFLNDPLDPLNPGYGWEINNYNAEPDISSNISVETSRKLKISNLNQVLWTRYENKNVTEGVIPNRYYMVESNLDFQTTEWVTYSPPADTTFIAFQNPATAVALGYATAVPRGGTISGIFYNTNVDYGKYKLPFQYESLDTSSIWSTTLYEYTATSSTISQYFELDFNIQFAFPMNPNLISNGTNRKTSLNIRRSFHPYYLSTDDGADAVANGPFRLPVGRNVGPIEFNNQRIMNLTWSSDYKIWSGKITTDPIGPLQYQNERLGLTPSQAFHYWPINSDVGYGEKVWVELVVVYSSASLRQSLGFTPLPVLTLPSSFNLFTFSGTFSNVVSGTISVTQISGITASNILTFDNFDQETALAALYPGFTASTVAGFNHLSYTSSSKIEYFFNKSNLEMTTFHSNQNALYYFGNISFWEVDMIPFFKYANTDEIDTSIYPPFYATAPKIDYNNTNFDFIGNISLTIDTQNIIINQVNGLDGGSIRPLDNVEISQDPFALIR